CAPPRHPPGRGSARRRSRAAPGRATPARRSTPSAAGGAPRGPSAAARAPSGAPSHSEPVCAVSPAPTRCTVRIVEVQPPELDARAPGEGGGVGRQGVAAVSESPHDSYAARHHASLHARHQKRRPGPPGPPDPPGPPRGPFAFQRGEQAIGTLRIDIVHGQTRAGTARETRPTPHIPPAVLYPPAERHPVEDRDRDPDVPRPTVHGCARARPPQTGGADRSGKAHPGAAAGLGGEGRNNNGVAQERRAETSRNDVGAARRRHCIRITFSRLKATGKWNSGPTSEPPSRPPE